MIFSFIYLFLFSLVDLLVYCLYQTVCFLLRLIDYLIIDKKIDSLVKHLIDKLIS